MMPTVTLTKGLPGSGKTTWARKRQAEDSRIVLVCKDDLRAMLHDGHHSKTNEAMVLDVRDAIILRAMEDGRNVIVADTNLDPKHVQRIRGLCQNKATVHIQDFTDVPLAVCIANDLKRPNSVGSKVIKRMYRQYIAPAPEPAFSWSRGLPLAVICDLDGTLAELNGRNPYDASTCEQDGYNTAVLEILQAMMNEYKTMHVLFTSGRQDTWREQTQRWLDSIFERHHRAFLPLFMRAEGDTRPDSVVKKELYEQHIKDQFNVMFVLDDRDSVVELWRSLGLTCLQVADGDF